jgi:hypothetical protein
MNNIDRLKLIKQIAKRQEAFQLLAKMVKIQECNITEEYVFTIQEYDTNTDDE